PSACASRRIQPASASSCSGVMLLDHAAAGRNVGYSSVMKEVERTHFIAGVEPRVLYEIVTDYEHYPRIFPEFTGVRVLAREGALARVELRARMVKEVHYALAISNEETTP